MKILLTGSEGNLGQALQRRNKAHQWVGLDRGDWSKLPELIKGVEVVIHAASDLVTLPRHDPKGVMESNLMTTLQLLEELNNKRKVKLIFISSCAVYGHSAVTEEHIVPAPISINGITKLLNEELIKEFCAERGIEVRIYRLFNTFGGQDRFSIISHLQRSLAQKKPFLLFNEGVSQRDFVHVDDIAQVIVKLLDQPISHPVMNIGSGQTVRISDIVAEFKKKNPRLKVNHATRHETEYSRADISKLRQILPKFRFRSVLDYIRDEL